MSCIASAVRRLMASSSTARNVPCAVSNVETPSDVTRRYGVGSGPSGSSSVYWKSSTAINLGPCSVSDTCRLSDRWHGEERRVVPGQVGRTVDVVGETEQQRPVAPAEGKQRREVRVAGRALGRCADLADRRVRALWPARDVDIDVGAEPVADLRDRDPLAVDEIE